MVSSCSSTPFQIKAFSTASIHVLELWIGEMRETMILNKSSQCLNEWHLNHRSLRTYMDMNEYSKYYFQLRIRKLRWILLAKFTSNAKHFWMRFWKDFVSQCIDNWSCHVSFPAVFQINAFLTASIHVLAIWIGKMRSQNSRFSLLKQ